MSTNKAENKSPTTVFSIVFLPLLLASTLWRGATTEPATSHPGRTGEMLITSRPSAVLLEAGRENLLRFRLESAESDFHRLSSRPDGRAAAYYHLSAVSLLKILVTDAPAFYTEFYARSDTLRELLDGLPPSDWSEFFGAEASLHRAIVRAKHGRYLRAAVAGRNAYRSYRKLVEASPAFYDGYKGLGLLEMAVGAMPGLYRTFLGILGVHGSVEEGLAKLNLASTSSLFGKEESVILLSLFDVTMDVDNGNRERLRELYDLYPDSPLFSHLQGFVLYSDRKAVEAERVLRPVVERDERDGYSHVDYIDFFLGDALFRQDRFQEASIFFQRYLDNHQGPALKATASLQLGRALEMMGNRLAAESFYSDVKATREFDSDQVAKRSAERLLAGPMSEAERQLLLGENAFGSSRHSRAQEIFGALAADERLELSLRAEAAYRLGRSYHVTEDPERAIAAYRQGIELCPTGHRWAPWSEYYVGKILAERRDFDAARDAFRRALTYEGGFDYHQALEKNAKLALGSL